MEDQDRMRSAMSDWIVLAALAIGLALGTLSSGWGQVGDLVVFAAVVVMVWQVVAAQWRAARRRDWPEITDFAEEVTGNLVVWAQGDPEPVVGTLVFYTITLDRLRGMLAAAAAGEPVDDVILALDAAVMHSDAYGDNTDYDNPEGSDGS